MKTKRLLSIVLSVALCLSLLPTAAMANDEYTITFYADDNKSESYTQTASAGTETLLIPNKFVREGYMFGQWKTPSGSTYNDGGKITLNNDMELVAQWVAVSGSLGTATYEISDSGVLTIHGGVLNGYYNNTSWPWDACRDKINKVVFDGDVTAYGGLVMMFSSMRNLTKIEGIEHLNTENVTSMWGLFSDCFSLGELDVSGFKTAYVTNMGFMFRGCRLVSSLDVSGFITSNVTDMQGMFHECLNLRSVDLSHFNTAKVTNIMVPAIQTTAMQKNVNMV